MIIARFACYTLLQDQLSELQGTLPDLHRKDCTGGGGGWDLCQHDQWGQIEVSIYAQPYKNQMHHPV